VTKLVATVWNCLLFIIENIFLQFATFSFLNFRNIPLENFKGRDHLEDLDVDGKKILEWILGK